MYGSKVTRKVWAIDLDVRDLPVGYIEVMRMNECSQAGNSNLIL